MSGVFIRTIKTRSGKNRYRVSYRMGGRGYREFNAGTFGTRREAEAREMFVRMEIAAGRDPQQALDQIRAAAQETKRKAAPKPFSVWADEYPRRRRDLQPNTEKNYLSMLKRASVVLGAFTPEEITWEHIDGWVGQMLEDSVSPSTIRLYLTLFRRTLDDILGPNVANPARDKRISVPKHEAVEINPPPAEHVEAILFALPRKYRLMFAIIEQGAFRLEEAASRPWGDVDIAGLRVRLPKSATKTHQSRWVYLPEWLIEMIDRSCPLEDRTPERKVLQGVTAAGFYQAMTRACRDARVPHYHPHELRHRRISIWHQAGVSARAIADRAGHSPMISLSVYSHVMPTAEVSAGTFVEALT